MFKSGTSVNRFFLLAIFFISLNLQAKPLTIEITEGVEMAIPIAIVPFQASPVPTKHNLPNISEIVAADLTRSGLFKPLATADMPQTPYRSTQVKLESWRILGMENIAIGQYRITDDERVIITFELIDVFLGKPLISTTTVETTLAKFRTGAHEVSDRIYEKLIGQKGVFNTRIAYITSNSVSPGKNQFILEVADIDGYGPKPIFTSSRPILSPAWSPDGNQIAYVSFEQNRPHIYIHNLISGKKERVSATKGINGAPSWSPDGTKLALTLSKDGNPDIYIMDLPTRRLKKLTRHYAIDTEPTWSPDGSQIVYTSDRGGRPQLYKLPADGSRSAERITFEGKYNARASFSPDGRYLTYITGNQNIYQVAVMELATLQTTVLTEGRLDESPSFSPNSAMIIYSTELSYSAVLSTVSVDGKVRQKLGLQNGDVREPAWSP